MMRVITIKRLYCANKKGQIMILKGKVKIRDFDAQDREENYVARGGVYCPYCESDEIEGSGAVNTDIGVVWQKMQCLKCKKRWEDKYDLVGISESK